MLISYAITSILAFAIEVLHLLSFGLYDDEPWREDYAKYLVLIIVIIMAMYACPIVHSWTVYSIYKRRMTIAKEINVRGTTGEEGGLGQRDFADRYAPHDDSGYSGSNLTGRMSNHSYIDQESREDRYGDNDEYLLGNENRRSSGRYQPNKIFIKTLNTFLK